MKHIIVELTDLIEYANIIVTEDGENMTFDSYDQAESYATEQSLENFVILPPK